MKLLESSKSIILHFLNDFILYLEKYDRIEQKGVG